MLRIRIQAEPDSNRQTGSGSGFGIRIRFLQVKLSFKKPVFELIFEVSLIILYMLQYKKCPHLKQKKLPTICFFSVFKFKTIRIKLNSSHIKIMFDNYPDVRLLFFLLCCSWSCCKSGVMGLSRDKYIKFYFLVFFIKIAHYQI